MPRGPSTPTHREPQVVMECELASLEEHHQLRRLLEEMPRHGPPEVIARWCVRLKRAAAAASRRSRRGARLLTRNQSVQ
jgi:hypothetical protein